MNLKLYFARVKLAWFVLRGGGVNNGTWHALMTALAFDALRESQQRVRELERQIREQAPQERHRGPYR